MYVLQKERDLKKALSGKKYLSVFKETIGKNTFVKQASSEGKYKEMRED